MIWVLIEAYLIRWYQFEQNICDGSASSF